MPSLVQELDELHTAYVIAIQEAIADGHAERAADLAASYDADAVELIAEREGKQHLLPLRRRTPRAGGGHRVLKRLLQPQG